MQAEAQRRLDARSAEHAQELNVIQRRLDEAQALAEQERRVAADAQARLDATVAAQSE